MFNFSFFSVTGQGIDLDYCDIEWFTKKKREGTQIQQNKKLGEITTDTTEIQNNNNNNIKNSYMVGNLDEMDPFLETHSLPKLGQKKQII